MAQIFVKGLGQRLRRGGPRGRAAGVPEINLIPQAYRPGPLVTRERAMVLLVMLELLVAALLFRAYGDSTLATLRRITGGEDTRTPEAVQAERLRQQIASLRARIATLEAAKGELKATSPDWPELLEQIFYQGPPGIAVSSLREIAGEVTVSGSATSAADMTEYREILLNTKGIQSVQVQAIGREPGTNRVTFTLQVKVTREGEG